MMLALEDKIRVTVFSEMLFRISRQTENKYDTCSGRRRRARSEPLSSQKCCSGQAGKEAPTLVTHDKGSPAISEMLFRTSRQTENKYEIYSGGQDQSHCLLRNAVQDKQAKREQVGTCSTGKKKER